MAVMILWATAPAGFFGLDLGAYVAAAGRLVRTGTPYHPVLFEVALTNDPSSIPFAYLYPPPLAQLFSILPTFDPAILGWVWIVAQAAFMVVLFPAVARRYAPTVAPIHRLAVVLAFAATSFSLNYALFIGNVSGWIAIGIALMLMGGGRTNGVVAAGLTLLKAVPVPFLLIALASRASRRSAVLTLGAAAAVSFVLDPVAWLDFARAVPHIAAMTLGPPPWNLSPAAVGAVLGLEEMGRAAGIGLTLAFAGYGAILARGDRWPAAVASAAISSLLISPTMWDHYVAAAVPLVIAAWWMATRIERALIVVSWSVMFLMWLRYGDPQLAVLYFAAFIMLSVVVIRALRRAGPDARAAPDAGSGNLLPAAGACRGTGRGAGGGPAQPSTGHA